MYLKQIYQRGLAHCSYVIGSGDKCMVVDPARNIGKYLETAAREKMKIIGILETHLHADFVSGHIELAKASKARIYAPISARCLFPHIALSDGEDFGFNKLKFRLLQTPGHTPECSVYLVSDLERGKEPVIMFTGDTLFVGDAGRPDLFPDKKEILAEKLFQSLEHLKGLPDRIEIYPTHGMGSLCGRSLSAKLWSTIGNERKYNYALGYDDVVNFKKAILDDMPEAPDHFARCSEINRKGPALLCDLKQPRALDTDEALSLIKKGRVVLDTRNNLTFASGHIKGSYNIDKGGNLPLFAGWIMPAGNKIILLTGDEGYPDKIIDALHSVGIDAIEGYMKDGIYPWIASGLPSDYINLIPPLELKKRLKNKEKITLVDNRLRREWLSGHIQNSVLMPCPDMRLRYGEFKKDETLVTICGNGPRSMTAASILKQKGFTSVFNLLGGIEAWKNLGYPLESREKGF